MDELTKTLCSSNYAKDNGVLLYNNDVYIREDTPALALLEVRRVLGRAFVPITPRRKRLTRCWLKSGSRAAACRSSWWTTWTRISI